ncbi:hypothetical protein BgiBS90_022760 [Biomphalaria glabrata]|nr:hypothetical protein BgiBS90_022760 [Biomphalaria glabrata]
MPSRHSIAVYRQILVQKCKTLEVLRDLTLNRCHADELRLAILLVSHEQTCPGYSSNGVHNRTRKTKPQNNWKTTISWILRADGDATRSRSYTSSWPTTPAAKRLLRLTLDKEIPDIREKGISGRLIRTSRDQSELAEDRMTSNIEASD